MTEGELHVHMNGAIQPSMLKRIMTDEGASLSDSFDIERDMVHIASCKSLDEHLKPW